MTSLAHSPSREFAFRGVNLGPRTATPLATRRGRHYLHWQSSIEDGIYSSVGTDRLSAGYPRNYCLTCLRKSQGRAALIVGALASIRRIEPDICPPVSAARRLRLRSSRTAFRNRRTRRHHSLVRDRPTISLQWRGRPPRGPLPMNAVVIEMVEKTPEDLHPGALAFAMPYDRTQYQGLLTIAWNQRFTPRQCRYCSLCAGARDHACPPGHQAPFRRGHREGALGRLRLLPHAVQGPGLYTNGPEPDSAGPGRTGGTCSTYVYNRRVRRGDVRRGANQ